MADSNHYSNLLYSTVYQLESIETDQCYQLISYALNHNDFLVLSSLDSSSVSLSSKAVLGFTDASLLTSLL